MAWRCAFALRHSSSAITRFLVFLRDLARQEVFMSIDVKDSILRYSPRYPPPIAPKIIPSGCHQSNRVLCALHQFVYIFPVSLGSCLFANHPSPAAHPTASSLALLSAVILFNYCHLNHLQRLVNRSYGYPCRDNKAVTITSPFSRLYRMQNRQPCFNLKLSGFFVKGNFIPFLKR